MSGPGVNVDNLCLLTETNENNILYNLQNRYKKDQIYTFIGNVLVSVNPFKNITPSLYTPSKIQQYRNHYPFELSPHVYSIAEDAYRSLLGEQKNQAIIITGESGAGKTEASKQIMNYLAAVSDITSFSKAGQITSKTNVVKEQILESNPILESFGNAKTVRNNNSSRFGKYMEILFNHAGDIIGGRVMNFLLEKSRVVRQAIGERNFHIFYQLFTDANLKSKLSLTKPEDFHYLRESQCLVVPDINDTNDFKETRTAMTAIKMSEDDQMEVFQLLAGILHLGNITFTANAKGHAEIKDLETVKKCASNLGTDPNLLRNNILNKSVEAGGRASTYMSPLSVPEAEYARDALAKGLYGRLFNDIVHKINNSIHDSSKDLLSNPVNSGYDITSDGTGKSKNRNKIDPLVIGILDIYGFEIFENNSFEQLCINYVNERLQQIFIELTLKEEQEEYVREGIKWKPVDYVNNIDCVRLIDQKMGIFDLLNEASLIKGEDKDFIDKIQKSCSKHPWMIWDERDRKVSNKNHTFTIKHYAGVVEYDSAGFVTKNLDTLFTNVINLMLASKNMAIKNLFSTSADEGAQQKGPKARPPMISTQFKKQVDLLMDKLHQCKIHYIRTMKPNDQKKPNLFIEENMRAQIRYLGILENVIVRQAGFIYREKFKEFHEFFRVLTPETYPRWTKGDDKSACEHILQYVVASRKDIRGAEAPFQIGKTKIFIKYPEVIFGLEELKQQRLHELATQIQKVYRGWIAKKFYIELKNKSIDLITNNKNRRRISVNRSYIGDYLSMQSFAPVMQILQKSNDSKVMFSQNVDKINNKYKVQNRLLVLTDQHMYNLNSLKKLAVKRMWDIKDLISVTLSPFADCFMVMQFTQPYDFLFYIDDKTELTILLRTIYENATKKELPVRFSDKVEYKFNKKEKRTVTFTEGDTQGKPYVLKPNGAKAVTIVVDKSADSLQKGTIPKNVYRRK